MTTADASLGQSSSSVMRSLWRDRRIVDAVLGVVIALSVGLGVIMWTARSASDGLDTAASAGSAIFKAEMAALGGEAVQNAKGADAVGPFAAQYKNQTGVEALSIVSAPDRILLADGTGAAPRPLGVGDKDLYDRVVRLAAHAETNEIEGQKRKPEILIAQSDQGRYRASAPIRSADGDIVAMAEVETAPVVAGGLRLLLWSSGGLVFGIAGIVFAMRQFPGLGTQKARAGLVVVVSGLILMVIALGVSAQIAAKEEGVLSSLALAQENAFAAAEAAAAAQGVTLSKEPSATSVRSLQARGTATLFRDSALFVVAGATLMSLFGSLGGARRLGQTFVAHRSAYAYVAPAVLGALLLVFFPLIYGVLMSFTDTTLFNVNTPIMERWTGLSNYGAILGDFDIVQRTADGLRVDYQNFYWTVFVTLLWTVSNVVLGVTIGLGLALVLNTPGLKGKTVYRILLVLPWAVPNYITALTWRGMFHPQFGVINQGIELAGGERISWFDHFGTSFLTGLATNVWLSFPFMMVVSLGALQSINRDMYEAARLEGASWWQQFRHITLPSVQPALIPSIILSVVWTFNMFNVIYLTSAGEPAGANEILITKAYKIGFEQYRYGYSAAYAVIIFMILFVYGYFQVKATSATEAKG